MTTRLHLRCDGCDAETHSERIRKTFVSVLGRPYGFGSWPDLEAVTPAGWVWSDPYTGCTYCPECWKEIENTNWVMAPGSKEPATSQKPV